MSIREKKLVIGALYDLAGFLTTRSTSIAVGATEDSAPMADLLLEFIKIRGLYFDVHHTEPEIDKWQDLVDDPEPSLLQGAIDSVTNWHKATGLPAPERVTFSKMDWRHPTRVLRRKLLQEEYEEEYLKAEETDDVVELADALADMMYIIIGTAVSYGIPLEKVMRAVCNTNDAKLVFNERGEVRRREDGKILKPDGWEPPDIKAILDAHGYQE